MFLSESIKRLDELLGGETEARDKGEQKLAKRDAREIPRVKRKPKRPPKRGLDRVWVTP